MSEKEKNLRIWNAAAVTDLQYTKHVSVPYPHTDINATYLFRRATEMFGPCGLGWGYQLSEPKLLDNGLVLVRVSLWYRLGEQLSRPIVVDGAKPLQYTTEKGHEKIDDEAPKKAASDGLKKALSLLGFSADIFMGDTDGTARGKTPQDNKAARRTTSTTSEQKTGQRVAGRARGAAGALPPNGAPKCPKCGKTMRKRSGKKGEFWGCSKYPDCRGTRDVADTAYKPPSKESTPFPEKWTPNTKLPKGWEYVGWRVSEAPNDYWVRMAEKGSGVPKEVADAELDRREKAGIVIAYFPAPADEGKDEPDDHADAVESNDLPNDSDVPF